MIKNMKNLITFGIFVFILFSFTNSVFAFDWYVPPTVDNQIINYNHYDQGYYTNRNTGYINTNYMPSNETIYGSDPITPKPATVIASNSGAKVSTVSNNIVKNTTTTKSTNNMTNTNKTVANNSNSSEDIVSGSSSDSNNNRNSIVALSAYGTDSFLPDTIFEWILVFFLILIVIVLMRLIGKKRHSLDYIEEVPLH